MFGSVMTATDPAAVSGVRLLLDLIGLLVDRQGVADQISHFIEERGKAERAIAELHEREQAVSHREQQATAHEEALAKREADVAEREVQVRHAAQRVEEQKSEIAALRADLRAAWAA
jgi:hypothetical protein